jgi:NADH dehydrogenase
MNMIIVTGASGYLGSHITRKLQEANLPVRAMVRNQLRAEKEGRLSGLDIEWVEADVTKPNTLFEALKGASTIVHTVAIAIEKGGKTYDEINYKGTVNVIEAAKQQNIKRLINISQLGADANLPYRFLASKGKAQDDVATSGLDWTAFRPSVIWGPEDEFANTFAKLALITPLIFPIVGDEKSLFQPVWVGDVAASVVEAVKNDQTIGKEYELGGPEVLTLEEIERRTLKAIGARRVMIRFPLPLLRLIVAVMEKLLPSPPVTLSLLELLQVSNVCTKNAINEFIEEPLAFTPENTEKYMKDFSIGDTLAQLAGR